MGDSSYSYFRKGKLHTVRRVYIQRLAYDPEGNLIGEKILKEAPHSLNALPNKSHENYLMKTYTVRGYDETPDKEFIFSPSSRVSVHEPSRRSAENSKLEDTRNSCKFAR